MEKIGADFFYSLNTLRDRFNANAHPIQIPIGAEEDFEGIIDLVRMRAEVYTNDLGTDILDEEIPEEYLAQAEEITEAELKAAIRKATINVEFYPMLAGSAFKNKGVQMMLDAVVDYLPAPTDVPAIKGVTPEDRKSERHADDSEPFAALAFKVMTDPFVGRLTFFRVYSGVLSWGRNLWR